MPIITELSEVKRILQESKTVAVLGAHHDVSKAAYYVPRYLDSRGYDVFPVNAVYVGRDILGKTTVSKLSELTTAIDLVDVFRRSEAIPEHLEDILAMKPLPKVVWLQLGIQNDEAAQKLSEAGIEVVQNRCTLADHQMFFGS
ncbi:MAG: CoA-binding protein [Trueperaceae bacterium]